MSKTFCDIQYFELKTLLFMGSYILKFCISVIGFIFFLLKDPIHRNTLSKKMAENQFWMGIQEANGVETASSCCISTGLPSHLLRTTEVRSSYNHYLCFNVEYSYWNTLKCVIFSTITAITHCWNARILGSRSIHFTEYFYLKFLCFDTYTLVISGFCFIDSQSKSMPFVLYYCRAYIILSHGSMLYI